MSQSTEQMQIALDKVCTVSKENEVNIPDLSDRLLVPRYISFHDIVPNETTLDYPRERNLSCKVRTNAIHEQFSRAYFQIQDTIDLFEYSNSKDLAKRLQLNIRPERTEYNNSTTKKLSIHITYVPYSGHVIWQETFSLVKDRSHLTFHLNQLKHASKILRVHLKTSIPIKKVSIFPECRKLKGEIDWLDDICFSPSNEEDDSLTENENEIVLDFSENELTQYSKLIEFLNFDVEYENTTSTSTQQEITPQKTNTSTTDWTLHMLIYGL